MILKLIKIRNIRRKNLTYFRKFLCNGFCFYDGIKMSRKPFSKNFIKNLFQIYFIFSTQKHYKIKETIIACGTYKKGILVNDEFYTFCLNDDIYQRNKNNYLLYFNDFIYPAVKVNYFDDVRRLISLEYLNGKVLDDRKHLIIWAKEVLQIALSIKYEIKDGILYYLQHGDAHCLNVLWIDDEKFKYIDLDNIGMWPALYDIILGLTISLKQDAFIIIENDLKNLIILLFSKYNIVYSIDTLDIYYSEFIKIWMKRDISLFNRIISPFYELDKEYKFVHQLLNKCGL